VAAFDGEPRAEITLLLQSDTRENAQALAARWKKPPARVQVIDDGLAGVARLLAQTESEHVVLGTTASLFLTDPRALRERVASCGDQVVKLSVARTPVELYASRREHFQRQLAAVIERGAPRGGLREALFDGVLHDSLELILDLPGEILFQSDLMECYANNLWVVSHGESERLNSALGRLPELVDRGVESHVAERAHIRNSWLASGVEVEGVVEDSILFPNVVVRRNAHVVRSVILSGNRIGTGAEIQSSLILPFTAEVPRPNPNIGDNCSIGARSSTMKNSDFPSQIRDGIAVIGTNVDIPSGFKAEAATYVAPGVSAAALRRLKVLKKGASVLRERPAAAASGGNGAGELP